MRWTTLFVAGCLGRVPVYSEGDEGFHYEEPESDGECLTDLDCMTNGCGNHCTAADAEGFLATCEAAAHLSYATCGCVSGRCRWFADASPAG